MAATLKQEMARGILSRDFMQLLRYSEAKIEERISRQAADGSFMPVDE